MCVTKAKIPTIFNKIIIATVWNESQSGGDDSMRLSWVCHPLATASK